MSDALEFVKVKTFGKFLRSYKVDVQDYKYNHDLLQFLESVQDLLVEKIQSEVQALNSVKFQFCVEVELSKLSPDASSYIKVFFRTKQEIVTHTSDIDTSVESTTPVFVERLENYLQNGSGWIFERVCNLWLDIAKYDPIRIGAFIELPDQIKRKQAIINVQNKDENCLRWAIRSALFPVEGKNHPQRPTKYPTFDGLDFTGIDIPTPINQIKKVEKQNNFCINVFGLVQKGKSQEKTWCPYIVRLSKFTYERVINLLLLEKNIKGKIYYHFAWIKDISRLLYDQNKNKARTHFCLHCLHPWSSETLLKKHQEECQGPGYPAIKTELPEKGKNVMNFQNFKKQMGTPFIIYADFESIIQKLDTVAPNPKESGTQVTSTHIACGYCYTIVRMDGKTLKPKLYRGENAGKHFLTELQKDVKKIQDELRNPVPLKMTNEDKRVHEMATICWICEQDLAPNTDKEEWKTVRDHCHITGKYRGAAHSKCNLLLNIKPDSMIFPVVFHNLRGYDSHLLMQEISQVSGNLTCVPNNMEKYITFSCGNLKFIDSFQFMASSLDRLVKACPQEAFSITKKYGTEKHQLLMKKGIYPYEYMDNWDRFNEKELPPIGKFYSSLKNEGISEEEYDHAQTIWREFECKNLGDFHDLYLKTDVLLLADVFQNFRKTSMVNYGLDPGNYLTSPGLSWDALLKTTGQNLELLTDYEMYLFCEKGLRGGVSMVSSRYCKANNKYLEDFDKTKSSTYLLYLDANNLYGWAMSQFLPTGNFKWVKNENSLWTDEGIMKIPADSKTGYIYEVDVEYPEKLHDQHSGFPLLPEKIEVEQEWLSTYQKDLQEGNKTGKVKKLVPNLINKEKYVLHYRLLQQALQLGLKLTKVHRIVSFDQSPWMKPYIEKNTELRKKSRTDFEKDFYKLMNNAVYGKTMENLRKRINVRLFRSKDEEDSLRKVIGSPLFNRSEIFDHDLCAVHSNKKILLLNRPIYVGMSILDLSKMLMYDFFYNHLKRRYGDKCELQYTDTDSLIVKIETEDVYKDMQTDWAWYDTSEYPKDHFLYSEINKKVLGKMKDETHGNPISEFVGLRPKMYSIKLGNQMEIKRAKGVKKYVVEQEIRHELFKEVLEESKILRHEMSMLRSQGHNIHGLIVNKISLSPLDTKRWIDKEGVKTFAYGHYEIAEHDLWELFQSWTC